LLTCIVLFSIFHYIFVCGLLCSLWSFYSVKLLTFYNFLLVANIPTIIIGLVSGIIIVFICYDIVRRIIIGLKYKCFVISDEWKVSFSEKPFRFCSFVILYSLSFLVILSIGWFMVYNLFTR